MLLEKLTLRELTGEVLDAIKNKNSFTSIATINAKFTRKLVNIFISTLFDSCQKKAFLIKTLPIACKQWYSLKTKKALNSHPSVVAFFSLI